MPAVGDDGELLPETAACWRSSPSTGWCWRPGTSAATSCSRWSRRRARPACEDVVVTHPDFPAQDLSVDEQLELAGMGAWIERCFTTPHTGKCSWERWLEGTRAVGAERTILSSDLGQIQNPPVEDGLRADGRPPARGRLRRG